MQQLINWSKNKSEYKKYCKQDLDIPIFLQDWWLDIVCKNGYWNVVISKNKNNEIIGVLPFFVKRFFGFKVIQMPPLTPFCGIWLKYPSNIFKESSKISFEKKVMNDLIDQLPKTIYYAQRHPIELKNWLPFYWKGFEQTTRYTYRIKNPIDIEIALSNFKDNTRNTIVKAKRIVNITESSDVNLFYQLNRLSFERQSKSVPYTLKLIEELDNALSKRKQRKILIATDQNGHHHAAIYLVWDSKTVYNLMMGADTKLRNSGAVQLLLFEGIKFASSTKRNFDFEGSMMPNIEPVFRRFGGSLTPYFKIYKASNIFFKVLNLIR